MDKQVKVSEARRWRSEVLCVGAVALFVFFAGAAEAGVVAADFCAGAALGSYGGGGASGLFGGGEVALLVALELALQGVDGGGGGAGGDGWWCLLRGFGCSHGKLLL